MEALLTDLVERMKKAHGDRLVSITLYGSAAAGDHHEKFSDLNVLCVLTTLEVQDLAAAEPVFRWWRARRNPSPLLMSEHEVERSADCFPIEFQDMQESRRVLYGRDVIEGLRIDRCFYRAQVEHELRAKQLRLRQHAASVMAGDRELLRLLAESVSTFLILGRHALILAGKEAAWRKRDIAAQLGAIADNAPLLQLLDLREEKTGPLELNAQNLLAQYLQSVSALVNFVDGLEK